MADDVSAGRLHLDAVADTSGFGRDTKAKIDAELKNVRAQIKADLDTRGIIRQAREAAQIAQKAAVARLQTELDTRGLAAKAREAAALASKSAKVKIGAEIDQRQFATSLTAAVKALDGKYTVSVNVDADTAAAQARLAEFRASQRAIPIKIGTDVQVGNLGDTISKFAMFPALAGGVYLLVSAVGQLAGGLFAVTAAASQAVTAVAVLPNLVGALGQGIGVLVAGLSGIGQAVTELGQADAASAMQTQRASGIRQDSARAVADAQERLRDAYHQAADAARFARYAVSDAEWNLARAQEGAAEAQERLNEARVIARENLDELHESLRRAALSEAEAANALQKARQNLQDVIWDQSSTEQERRDAELAVKEAKVGLAEQRDAHKDLADETAKADEAGVKGSEEVLAAREQLRDANHSLMLAERQLKEARHSAADTAAQNAQTIADAQQAIVDAQRGGADAMQRQTLAMDQQMAGYNKLTPVAQRFARFLFDTVMPRFAVLRAHIQQAILPPIQRGITSAMPFIDTLEKGLLGTADVVGDLAERVGRLFGSKGFNKDSAAIMDTNNHALRLFGRAGFNLIKILSDIARVAGPTLLIPFAKWVVQVTKGWKAMAQAGRESGTMRDRFIKARETVALLASIVGNLAGAIHGVGKAATPTGEKILAAFDKASERWNNWANSDAGQARMQEFFDTIKPAFDELMRLIGNLSKTFTLLAENGGGPVAGMLNVLNGAIEGLNAVLDTPYLGAAVGWLLTLAGVGGGIGLIAGQLVKLGNGLKLLAKVSGLAKMWTLFSKSLLATRIQLMLLATWEGIVAGATAAMNAIMALNPFVAIGIAILAVIGLFILLYKKVDWFRNAVDWVWGKIVDGFNWVVDGAKHLWDVLFGHSIFPDLVDGLQWVGKMIGKVFAGIKVAIRVLGKVFGWLWDHAVKPAWTLIRKAISLVWNYYYKPILKLLGKGLHLLGAIFGWLWDKVVKPVWGAIQKAIEFAWEHVIKPAFHALGKALDVLGAAMKWLWDHAIKPAWDNIKRGIDTVWHFLRDKVFDPLMDLVKNDIPSAFRSAKDAIATIWDKLKGIASAPVEFIVDTVYNEGIRKVVNAIPGIDNLDELTFNGFKSGGVLPGYTPGRDVHRFYSPTAGGLALSGGEAIMRPEWTKAVGPKAIAAMNAAARRGGDVMRYFLGGIIPLDGGAVTGTHALPYYNTGATWAGDLNSDRDLANPPSAVKAWMAGTVANVIDSTTSYGRHVLMNHDGGISSLYAHLSSVAVRVGQQLMQGSMIGRVGATGNADGAHLHFERRGGTAPTGIAGTTLSGSAETDGGFFNAISKVKDFVASIPGWFTKIGNMEGWGGMMLDSIKSTLGEFRGWINDKIPGPGPLPGIFDRGGDWASGTAGVNLSGRTETVFTNENIVDITHDLAVIASRLRGSIVDSTTGSTRGADAPLVGELTLVGRDDERPAMLRDVNYELRKISLGGVHARRPR